MVEKRSAESSNRYRIISGSSVTERLFSWGKVQSEITSAENEYQELAESLSAANTAIEQLRREISELTAKYNLATAESAQIAERLAKETSAHEELENYCKSSTKTWEEERERSQQTIAEQEKALADQSSRISRLEADLSATQERSAELEAAFARKDADLIDKTERYTRLAAEYTTLLHEKNDVLDRLSASEESIVQLKYVHAKEIEDLNADFEERSRLFVPTIHELTRTVDSWKYQRECDLTEIHRLKTTLDAREEEIERLTDEVNTLKDIKKQMLTEINRMGFASVQADSEFRQREDELKEEQARLAREIGHLEDTKSSLEADLSAKQQTLASYSAITREILEEWKNHRDETCSCIADATGTVPACEHHVFIADISGHRVMFLAFAPASYEGLREADTFVRDAARKLAETVGPSGCRKEAFVVVPNECMLYLTKCLYASSLCSVQVITPSQVASAVRTVARFAVYEKIQNP